jgi:hypothetical protein
MKKLATCGLLGLLWLTPRQITAADDSDAIKLVTTGQVEKVDAKHKTFQFKFYLDPSQVPRRPPQASPYPGRMGGRRGRMGGYPGRRPFPNQPPDNSMEVKVYVSDATRFKGPSSSFQFSDLKPGDRITITATHHAKGDDLDAQAVVRN